jgi:hypothetical protein
MGGVDSVDADSVDAAHGALTVEHVEVVLTGAVPLARRRISSDISASLRSAQSLAP